MTRQPTGPGAGADDDRSAAAVSTNNGQLTRSILLQAALAIVDRDGVDKLSMRRLSNAVGRDPVMLDRHVPNKAAVLDGVAEIVLAQLPVENTDPDWAVQLRTVAHHFRQLALAHPNVVPLLVTRPLATPLGQRPPVMLRPLEDVLALLTSAGFAGDDALHIYRVLFGFLYGHILHELQEVIERPEETDHVLRLDHHWMETGSRGRDEVSRSARRPRCPSRGGSRRGTAVDPRHGREFGDLAGGPAPAAKEIPGGGTGPVRARTEAQHPDVAGDKTRHAQRGLAPTPASPKELAGTNSPEKPSTTTAVASGWVGMVEDLCA
jgi:AcrR family transcriptional regulator